ncbi:MAG: hypothetical protein JWM14_685 [Chitinophagaceae bacterium]|nr:hypothetical protein [Chitinophagaceae bacterium]
MKTIKQIIFGTALLTAVAFTSSCKKTADPGPAGTNGTNGTNGNAYPYKQAGTTLNLTGNFYSDDASFDNLISMPFFSTLEENHVEVSAPVLRNGTARTSLIVDNNNFYITRYDSLGNSNLSFSIYYDGGNDETYVNDFYFNVKTNITETSYKKVYTTNGGGGFRTSGPYDNETSLSEDDMNNDGNSFSISNWSYNSTTKVLSFDYSGTLTGAYNSTGSSLTVSGAVKANLKDESLRIAQ